MADDELAEPDIDEEVVTSVSEEPPQATSCSFGLFPSVADGISSPENCTVV